MLVLERGTEVEAGAERPALALDDHRPDVAVGLERLGGGDQLLDQLEVDAVELVRPVEPYVRDLAVDLGQHPWFGHPEMLAVDAPALCHTCPMPASQTTQLLDLKRSLGSRLEIEEVGLPEEWELADGVIRHRRTEFFQIVGQRFPDHGEMILIRQQETGLIALLVARMADESWVLIDARVEPGLPGGCQFTTTVQSTPSNYLRRHGGKATPFLDHFLEPGEDVRVLHDSRQYDWGQYYDSKIKRFMIVEIDADDALPATSETAVWVRERDLAELIRTDHAVTSDLRAMTTLLVAIRDGIAPRRPYARPFPSRPARPRTTCPCRARQLEAA